MPKGRNVKKAVKRSYNNAKRELGPIVKQIARSAVQAAKAEARTQGLGLLKKGGKFAMKNMFGNGDYRTNNLIHGGINQQPSFGSTSTTFRRREALGPVISSSTIGNFKIDKFRINAGIARSFPWLSGFANNYESWRPISLILEYVPTSGMSVASGDTTLGSVTMAAQYNPFATDPLSLLQIQAYPNSVTAAPYEHALCGIECKPSKRQADTLLVRNANVQGAGGLIVNTGYDTLFDLCEFFIATEGCQAANVRLGQLWVTYEIQLLNPILPLVQAFNPSLTLTSIAGSNYSPLDLFSTSEESFQWSGTDLAFELGTGGTANRIYLPYLPSGTYLVDCKYTYTGTVTAGNGGISTSGDITQLGGSDFGCPTVGVTTSTKFAWSVVITAGTTNSSSEITIAGLPSPGTIDKFSISIVRIPDAYPGVTGS